MTYYLDTTRARHMRIGGVIAMAFGAKDAFSSAPSTARLWGPSVLIAMGALTVFLSYREQVPRVVKWLALPLIALLLVNIASTPMEMSILSGFALACLGLLMLLFGRLLTGGGANARLTYAVGGVVVASGIAIMVLSRLLPVT